MPAAITRGRAALAVVGVGVAVLGVIAGCGADAQSATAPTQPAATDSGQLNASDAAGPDPAGTDQAAAEAPPNGLLTVDKPAPVEAGFGPADCQGAVAVHNNKHNICATWVNDAPNFIAVRSLARGPVNFGYDSIDAGGTEAHHVTKYPALFFGDTNWAATSAETGYGASMSWVFSSKEPSDTITGTATQDKDNDHTASCNGVQGYIACAVTRSAMTAINGERVHLVTYDLLNAPLTVMVVNNTAKPMAQEGAVALSNVVGSPRGTTTSTTIAPAQGGTASSAVFGAYRSTGGQAASLKVVYSFPDATYTDVTHKVTVAIEMVPIPAGDVASWGVDTSRSTCTDNPIGGSSPPKAQCTLGWTGVSTWVSSAAVTVNVSNA